MSDLYNILFPFSTDIYGDGGRSDCCVEHDSILGEKLSVSENQYYNVSENQYCNVSENQ